MRYGRLVLLIVVVVTFCGSCDILRITPFDVETWTPGGGFHAETEKITVSVSFSHEPDRTSIEKHFSLNADGDPVRGLYEWEGLTMRFLPLVPLEYCKDYSLKISAAACNTSGLSMDNDFEGLFTTRPAFTRPRVVSCRPETEGVMDSARGTCEILFSIPVSLNSLRNAASFSPSVPGAWYLGEGGTLAIFTPSEPWPHAGRFEMKLSTSVTSENGAAMGKDFFSIFTVGEKREPPRLESAWRLTAATDTEELLPQTLNEFYENSGWEKGDKLQLVFSETMDLLSVGTALAAEGVSLPVLEMPPDVSGDAFSREAVFRFDRPPAFNSRFTLRLKRGIRDVYGGESDCEYFFRILADGEKSKLPALTGIRLPMSPDGTAAGGFDMAVYGTDSLFADLPVESGHYPYNVKIDSWVELYFDCAAGAEIDPFSLMEMFRVETSNNVLIFSPIVIRNENFTAAEPHPAWEHFKRVEIGGTLTNTVNSGIVHFVVNQGLEDSYGNASEKQFRVSLVK